MGPKCVAGAGTDIETILRNQEINSVSAKPAVPGWVAKSFALNN
jgi:hypothetical protein